ncbi:MAG TPA: SMEK domain-containing protein [Pseudobacteroides sp.]|nr:SMEK domain-containing protein [Pseudobacteroides sp.]
MKEHVIEYAFGDYLKGVILLRNQKEINEITELITYWITQIRIQNAIGFFDINKISENLTMKLLNEIYGYNLKNLNYENFNQCGIDLGDDINSKVAFQVTSRIDAQKIKETLQKFVDNDYDKIFTNGIRFLILNVESVKLGRIQFNKIYSQFDKSKHIITITDLVKTVERIYSEDFSKFERVLNILSYEFKSPKSKDVDDLQILIQLEKCFDRPAFTTPFYMESNLPDFRKAITDTIEVINTGVYRLRDGTIIEKLAPRFLLKNVESKMVLNEIVNKLIDLRYLYDKFLNEGEIKPCGCNEPDCGVHFFSAKVCGIMDEKRREILRLYKSVLPSFKVALRESNI